VCGQLYNYYSDPTKGWVKQKSQKNNNKTNNQKKGDNGGDGVKEYIIIVVSVQELNFCFSTFLQN